MVYFLHAQILKSLAQPRRVMILDYLHSGEKSVGELADLLGLPQAKLLLFVGRLVPLKGLEILLQAMCQLEEGVRLAVGADLLQLPLGLEGTAQLQPAFGGLENSFLMKLVSLFKKFT